MQNNIWGKETRTVKKELMINSSWCKGCGICAAFCPRHVLEIHNEKVEAVRKEDCILCGQCELRCPDYAIWLEETEK
ncbi:MAG: 4Fe-4S binding protein [Solobacterium sp.]|nr:4Fe-4S binding protein [Solobacterium sp.]